MESTRVEICRPKFMSSLQRISKIRPQMVHKALNTIAIVEKSQQQRVKDVKVLQLFPCEKSQEEGGSSPMTIFYNGSVHAYNVSDDKARQIMQLSDNLETKYMEESEVKKPFPPSLEIQSKCGKGGLAIVRKASLQRFLQKRKDRLTSVSSPHYSPSKAQISYCSSLKAFPSTSEIQSKCGKGGSAIVRKASLQRFLQKRKDRLTSVKSPYYSFSSSSLKPFQRNLDLNLNLPPL